MDMQRQALGAMSASEGVRVVLFTNDQHLHLGGVRPANGMFRNQVRDGKRSCATS